MEIEVLTTKKKLNKALINQMFEVSVEELPEASPLGFVIVDRYPTIILKLKNGDYRRCFMDWKDGGDHLYRRTGRFTMVKKFPFQSSYEIYIKYLRLFKENIKQIYI